MTELTAAQIEKQKTESLTAFITKQGTALIKTALTGESLYF